jgi:hypothetical protein
VNVYFFFKDQIQEEVERPSKDLGVHLITHGNNLVPYPESKAETQLAWVCGSSFILHSAHR